LPHTRSCRWPAGLIPIRILQKSRTCLANESSPWTCRALNRAAGPGVLGAAYGVATVLVGVGLILAGVAVVRERKWNGWRRLTVLIGGIAVFVIVIPGVFGPFLAGRLAITAWMIFWAALGVALIARTQAESPSHDARQ
jgi:hypothetical protein